jgi:hypothetical protein
VLQAARQRCAQQIEDTLDWLHVIGAIWGDEKPGNVVFGQDDQAWLIDLSGGRPRDGQRSTWPAQLRVSPGTREHQEVTRPLNYLFRHARDGRRAWCIGCTTSSTYFQYLFGFSVVPNLSFEWPEANRQLRRLNPLNTSHGCGKPFDPGSPTINPPHLLAGMASVGEARRAGVGRNEAR